MRLRKAAYCQDRQSQSRGGYKDLQHFKGFGFRDFPVVIGLNLTLNRALFVTRNECPETRRAPASCRGKSAEHPVTDAVMFLEIADLFIVG